MGSNHNSAIIIHAINVRIAAGLEMRVFSFCLVYKQPSKAGVLFSERLQKTNSLRVNQRASASFWNRRSSTEDADNSAFILGEKDVRIIDWYLSRQPDSCP
jgi:hypothetical protein